MFNVDPDYMEKCIIKSALTDKNFLILIANKFEPEYFENESACNSFKYLSNHIKEFKTIPQEEIIWNSMKNDEQKESVKEFFKEIDSMDFDFSRNYEWVYEQTNEYLKDKALKQSIMDSADIIERNQDPSKIRTLIETALTKDIKIDLGLNYFDTLQERFLRIFNATNRAVPTGFPLLDELISGGTPPFTLSVWAAITHGGKSLLMANILSRQILAGYTGILFTLEMSEDAFAQRFDSIYSGLDVNRMYINKTLKSKLIDKLKVVKAKENRGQLWIKEYPTGKATVNDFRIYLKELEMRDCKPDVIYCDYINLLGSMDKDKNTTYEKIKAITEDLRALSLEFEAPVVSVTQINREGSFLNLKEVDFNYIAECVAIAHTADFVGILGHDPDKLLYESEIHYKISKNRLGGRVGTIGKLYMDSRSLKLYDETQFDEWISDAKESGDDRKPAPTPPPPKQSQKQKRNG